MEVVSCYCKKCNSEVGRFRNSWIGIGNTYFSPSYPPLSVDGMQATGDVYDAARDSQIQDSVLQDMACERCNEILGLRCDKAPEGHLLKKDQFILRLSEMSVLSEFSGKKAKISILKTHPLTFAPGLRRTSAVRAPSPISSPKLSVPRSMIPTELTSVPSSPGQAHPATSSTVDLAKFKSWAENAISSQQSDIDRISGTVERLDREMTSFKDFMEETRAQLSSHRIPMLEDSDKIMSLQDELKELRQKVDQNGSLMMRGSLDIARSVDVVVEDVQRISEKTSDVDVLKAQMADMQSQIRFLEAKQSSLAVSLPETGHPSSLEKRKYGNDYQDYTVEECRKMDGASVKRRKVSGAESPQASSPGYDRFAVDVGPYRVHTPVQEAAEVLSSSGEDLSLGLFVQQGETPTSDIAPKTLSNLLGSSNPAVTSHTHQERGMTSSTARVVINNTLRPSMMMPLRNGTILDPSNRSEFLEVSHIEAATGRKRDQHGRWQSTHDETPPASDSRRNRHKAGLNAVFANGLIDNSSVHEQKHDRRRSLRPRRGQNRNMLQHTTVVNSYDGAADEGDNGISGEEDNENKYVQTHTEGNDGNTVHRANNTKLPNQRVL